MRNLIDNVVTWIMAIMVVAMVTTMLISTSMPAPKNARVFVNPIIMQHLHVSLMAVLMGCGLLHWKCKREKLSRVAIDLTMLVATPARGFKTTEVV